MIQCGYRRNERGGGLRMGLKADSELFFGQGEENKLIVFFYFKNFGGTEAEEDTLHHHHHDHQQQQHKADVCSSRV